MGHKRINQIPRNAPSSLSAAQLPRLLQNHGAGAHGLSQHQHQRNQRSRTWRPVFRFVSFCFVSFRAKRKCVEPFQGYILMNSWLKTTDFMVRKRFVVRSVSGTEIGLKQQAGRWKKLPRLSWSSPMWDEHSTPGMWKPQHWASACNGLPFKTSTQRPPKSAVRFCVVFL